MNDRCPCGEPIYANTEDWKVPLCYECYVKGATMNRLKYLRELLDKEECGTIILRCENVDWLIRVAEAAEELNNQIENYGIDGFTLESGDKHAHISFKELRKSLEDRDER